MTVTITGSDLTIEQIVRVARPGAGAPADQPLHARHARRPEELVMLGEHIAAAELIAAAQAVELRGLKPLGRGTAEIVRLVRSKVPFMAEGVAMVSDLSELRALIRSGAIGAAANAGARH
jgi:histidine ammonia-lyase